MPDLPPAALFERSGSPVKRDTATEGRLAGEADRHPSPLHDHGHLLPASTQGQHLRELLGVLSHIHVHGSIAIGCPSLAAEGSGIGAVNDDLI